MAQKGTGVASYNVNASKDLETLVIEFVYIMNQPCSCAAALFNTFKISYGHIIKQLCSS